MLPARRNSPLHRNGRLKVFFEDSSSAFACRPLSVLARGDHCSSHWLDHTTSTAQYLCGTCEPSGCFRADAVYVAHLARPLASEARTALHSYLEPFLRGTDTCPEFHCERGFVQFLHVLQMRL